MKPLLLAVTIPCALLTACIDEREHDGHGKHHGSTLPSDAYYVGVPLPYRTVEDCLAGGKVASACTHAVVLCASGAYGVRHGDAVFSGRYVLDDRHAVNKSARGDHDHDDYDGHDGESYYPPFDFDVEDGELVLDPGATNAVALSWEPDYDGRWKTGAGAAIACDARPPRR